MKYIGSKKYTINTSIKKSLSKYNVPSIKMSKLTRDTDKDGVPNFIDCQPYNPKKQGKLHDWKEKIASKVKEKYEEKKAEFSERAAREKEYREKSQEAYYEARQTEAVEYGKQKAKIEAKRRLKRLQDRDKMYSSFGSQLELASAGILGRPVRKETVKKVKKSSKNKKSTKKKGKKGKKK